MIIHNVNLYLEDQQFHYGAVVIRGGRFAQVLMGEVSVTDLAEPGEEVIDGRGAYAIPGLIDTHFHGARNQDVCDATTEAYRTIADYELSVGVTAICPATLTLSVEELGRVLAVGAAFARAQRGGTEGGADLIGFNMEGPFISRAKKGAQNEAYILPTDIEILRQFMDASEGLVRFTGLAPEENPGCEEFIRAVAALNEEYVQRAARAAKALAAGNADAVSAADAALAANHPYIQVAFAHSNADYDAAHAAFRAGASRVVHLYNAMTGLGHRAPGAIGAVSDHAAGLPDDTSARDYSVEIICDGVHIHPAAVRAAFRMIGSEYMVMISDSLRPVGMEDGEYMLGGQPIHKTGNICRLAMDGNIAGAVTNLADCMRTAVRDMEIPLETAVACCTINPARSIHRDDEYGSIETGKRGDLVLLGTDENLALQTVIKDGVRVG